MGCLPNKQAVSRERNGCKMRLENLYGKLNMSWLRVLLFAVAAGVYTGVVLVIPVLKDTSFQDIGTYFEWWVIFAVIIVVNCRKNLEAMIKCFVFFLISQPVVFAVEVLVGYLDLERALYYYTQIWLPITLLTLPGGFLASYCSRQNAFGAVVLGLGNTIQATLAVVYLVKMVSDFPHHLLSFLVCVGSIPVMTFCIQKKKSNRLIALLLPILLLVLLLILAAATGRLHV